MFKKIFLNLVFTYNPTINADLAFSTHEPFNWSLVSVNVWFCAVAGQPESLKNVMVCGVPIDFFGRAAKIAKPTKRLTASFDAIVVKYCLKLVQICVTDVISWDTLLGTDN